MTGNPGASVPADLDAAIDALYQSPLDRFTSDRNALAAALRKAGDRTGAERVKALPRPSAAAWAVNQVWWRDQARFREMLDAAERLRAAHVSWGAGRPSADVHAAAESRQRAVASVIESAIEALGGPGHVTPDLRHRIVGTVEALAAGGLPPDVTPGRLSKERQSTGLEALSALAGLAPPSAAQPAPARPVLVSRTDTPPGRSTAAARDRAKKEGAAGELAKRVAEARTRLADREAALRAAEVELAASQMAEARARASAEQAAARVNALEQQLDQARDEERAARRALADATRNASENETTRARTSRDVAAARAALQALEKGG
jgi:hypothetical protein